MADPMVLRVDEVVERYRGQISEGTLRNWRSIRIGPSFIKIGKAILYPLEELDRWDRRNLVVCRPSRSVTLEEAAERHVPDQPVPKASSRRSSSNRSDCPANFTGR
jgi:hypothetical protein